MLRDHCLRTTNGTTTTILAPASATLNNRTTGSCLVVFQCDNVLPGTQRNLFGKSSGVNRTVLINNTGGFAFQYGSGSGGATDLSGVVAGSALPLVAFRPCVLGAVWQHGAGGLVRLYGGLVGGPPLREATSYTTQVTGTMGSTPHDDSASALGLGATPAGANVYNGYYWSIQWWDTVLPLPVLQARARDYNPVGSVGSWRFGTTGSGLGLVVDDSGHGNHATITAGPVLSADPWLVHRRGKRPDPLAFHPTAPAVVPPSGTETASVFVSTPV